MTQNLNKNNSMKKTNAKQFEKMVALMLEHPEVGRGLGSFGASKKSTAEQWKQFGEELNTLGPPVRDGPGWNKVWLDFKLKLKKKLAANRKESVATGGGPYSQVTLSPLEQAVESLLSLNEAVNPEGPIFGPRSGISDPSTSASARNVNSGFRTSGNGPSASEDGPSNCISVPEDDETMVEYPHQESEIQATPRKRMRSSLSDVQMRERERLELLKKQTANQEELMEEVKNVNQNLKEIARYARKNFELKKEKEARKAKEHQDRMRMHKEKMEIKVREIELKELKYNMNK